MGLLVKVIYPCGVNERTAPLNAMHFIAFLE